MRKSGLPKKKNVNTFWLYNLFIQFALLHCAWELVRIRLFRWWGDIVVCDRYLWDNYVILKEKLPESEIETWLMWKIAKWLALPPDLSVFLSLSAKDAYDRIVIRAGGVASQTVNSLAKRENLYNSITERAGWVVLPATKPAEELSEEIWCRFQVSIS